jgi:hypothetical protein
MARSAREISIRAIQHPMAGDETGVEVVFTRNYDLVSASNVETLTRDELAELGRKIRIYFWVMPGSGDVLLCDQCYEELTGDLAHCQDACSLSLDHDGECDWRPRPGQTACDRCGRTGRLTRVDVENLA